GIAVLFIVVLLFLAAPALGQQPPSFAGKTVTLVVGYNPGGGYDQMARMIARYLPKYLPGNPTVIVQNMPGANSITAANHVYTSRPDGLTIGAFNRNLILGQLVKVPAIRFDMNKFAWIGSPAAETTILAIRSDLPYRTPADLIKADPAVIVGATGPGASTYDFPLLLKALAKMNLRIIPGYPASGDIMLAVERKEVDGRAGSYSSIKPFIDRGLVRPIVRSRASVPAIAALPTDESLVSDERARAVMRLRAVPEQLGRPYMAPPGTPADILRAYWEAFTKISTDAEFVAEAERAGFEIDYVRGDEAMRIVRALLSASPDVVKVFSQFFNFN
ncbi:MAG: Bug family tripartite tricarboxylate transporter substrate binding protein, partial [bacterium]